MRRTTPFLEILNQVDKRTEAMQGQIELIRQLYESGGIEEAYEYALRLEESAEKNVLLTRTLPAYTGNPAAKTDVEQLIRLAIPVEIGFTEQGWFSVRIPALLPKKSNGSADYIRSFLYPAMNEFFEKSPPVSYTDCVLIYRHIYNHEYPERQRRDHDNIELNMVSDIIAMYVMPDDGPSICSHYYCTNEGTSDRTEIYVVPKRDFALWLNEEKQMPDKGVKLYETMFFSKKKHV